VLVEPDASTADAAPVQVRVRELPLQRATIGVGISADTGPRVSLEHLHRRVFGLNWQATTRIELGRDKRLLGSDFVSHPKPGGYRNLLSGLASREITGAVTVDSRRLRAGRSQEEGHIRRLYYLEWQDATTHTDNAEASAGAMTGNYEWAWYSLDNELLPTRGVTLSAKLGAGRSFAVSGGGRDEGGWFSRATGRATFYRPVGNWFTQTRIELGQVFARQDVGIPYTLLFRAGGEQSVRGYAYQSLGPGVDAFGRAVGGRVLATGSVEFAHPISARFPDCLGAVFVDACNAAPRWSYF
jgi:translocation and assembly module TamA